MTTTNGLAWSYKHNKLHVEKGKHVFNRKPKPNPPNEKVCENIMRLFNGKDVK